MFNHNLDPIAINLGFIAIRWYSLAYIFGIILGWWLGKKIINHLSKNYRFKINSNDFDEYITYLVISIILGGRLGYVFFYNFEFYSTNLLNIFKIWEGGMSFHGALIGIVLGTYFFSKKTGIKKLILLDIVACVSPIGIFFGRIANFINSELYGKPTNALWGVIFTKIDKIPRHPSQLYEAFLEGIVVFLILNLIIFNFKYRPGYCSSLFLIIYGVFRIIVEQYRIPDPQIGLIFQLISMGSILSILMISFGIMLFFKSKKNES
jgi:phosphatidylglycerol:prolipoprotein diacylglycerol transferase